MKSMQRQSWAEDTIYLILWGILFASPLVSFYIRSVNAPEVTFNWTEILIIWRKFALFFVIFLLHNFLLAPLLIERGKKLLYAVTITLVVVLFTIYQCSTRPDTLPLDRPMDLPEARHPQEEEFFEPRPPHEAKGPRHHHDKQPPFIIGEHDIVAVVILILLLGMNLGIKHYFKTRENQQKLADLEKENLAQQLEYLKYQINPHFLMNTLNNIHTLIEIDQEKAQEAVIQLSKILRYVLYDSNKKWVLMSQEVAFMENYVKLMRMRYTDRLRFTVSSPDQGTGVLIPPMLFISFVENAFKHGVSYREESFIEIIGKRYKNKSGEERLLWTCRNSKHQRQESTAIPRQGGVGLTNVRQRLDLIFNDRYTLDIREQDDTYEVILDIPLGTEN